MGRVYTLSFYCRWVYFLMPYYFDISARHRRAFPACLMQWYAVTMLWYGAIYRAFDYTIKRLFFRLATLAWSEGFYFSLASIPKIIAPNGHTFDTLAINAWANTFLSCKHAKRRNTQWYLILTSNVFSYLTDTIPFLDNIDIKFSEAGGESVVRRRIALSKLPLRSLHISRMICMFQ